MRLFHKFLLGFLVMVSLIMVTQLISVYYFNQESQLHDEIVKHLYLGMFLEEKEGDHFAWMEHISRMFVEDQLPEVLTNYDDCSLGKWYYSYESEEHNHNIYTELEEPHIKLHETGFKIIELYESGNIEEAKRVYQTDMISAVASLREVLQQFQEVQEIKIQELEKDEEEKQQTVRKNIIIIVAIALLISLLIVFILNKIIVKPIKIVSERAIKVSEGDLSVVIEGESVEEDKNTKDEIKLLSGAFDKMVKNIRVLVSQIDQTSTSLAKSSEELSSASQNSSATFEEVAASIEEMAVRQQVQSDYFNEVNSNVQGIFEQLSDADKVGKDSLSLAEVNLSKADVGEKSINLLIEQMDVIKETIGVNAEVSHGLVQQVDQIEEIVNFIDNIARQTQLLALNAAIEAARAGDAGLGFSVVSDEIKSLAEETTNSATRIKELIKNTQKEANQSYQVMLEGKDKVDIGINIVNQTRQLFADIFEASKKTSAGSEQTAASIEKISSLVEELKDKIGEASRISMENSASSQEVAASTEEQTATIEQISAMAESLNEVAERLEEMMKQFET
ncbi:MAG: CZB domain-containing protein [Halanaerobiales bacterium]|nr:CZB domain-containing protein [Halanaerobiales bacterium]